LTTSSPSGNIQTSELSEDLTESALSPIVVLLTPAQISAQWSQLSLGIAVGSNVSQEQADQFCTNMLQSLLTGHAHCWLICSKETPRRILGVATTTKTADTISGTTSLLIYSLYAYGVMGLSIWKECFRVLSVYAKMWKLDKIVAYSSNKRVIEMAKRYGATTEQVVLEMEILPNTENTNE
jgi:hypothetical protein